MRFLEKKLLKNLRISLKYSNFTSVNNKQTKQLNQERDKEMKTFKLQAAFGAINRTFTNYVEAVQAYMHTQFPKTLLSVDEKGNVKVVYSHS